MPEHTRAPQGGAPRGAPASLRPMDQLTAVLGLKT